MKVFWSKSLPNHWIVEDENGKKWLVPAMAGGWEKKAPYLAPSTGLELVEGETARLALVSAGAR